MDEPVELRGRPEQDDPQVVEGDPPNPPQPPLQSKRWVFYRRQLVGIPVLVAIVVLALFGVFGDKQGLTTADNDTLELTVEVVERFRFKMIGPLEITVQNLTDSAVTGVTVRVDRRYLSQFSTVVFAPAATSVTADSYIFDLGEIASGDTKIVTGEIQAEAFGRHTGNVAVTADGVDALVVPVETFSFP